jgi:transitional endoplasmic reticulum ATPase
LHAPSGSAVQQQLDDDDDYAISGEATPATTDATFDMDAAVQLLSGRLAAAEADAALVAPPEIVAVNLRRVQALVGLSDVETRILTFSTMFHTDQVLELMSDWVGELTSAKLFHALGAVLAIPEKQVRAALSSQGTLARSRQNRTFSPTASPI